MIHNVALDGNDDIGMNQKKPNTYQAREARDGHHFRFSHPYIRFTPVLDMWTLKAHDLRPKDAPDGSQCYIRW